MRNLFSKGLLAAAAVMMFASCSNEEGVNVPVANGDQTKVTLGVSVLGSKAAADMNFADPTQLTNVAVVPFVGNAPQKPIQWASVTSTTEPVVAQMVNTVDHFKVYGNLTGTQYGKTADVYGLTDADFALTEAGVISGNQTYNPHEALYYFADATSFYRATEGDSWENVTNWGDLATGAINDAKYIKISGVSYAVGTLAAAVMNGDATACFYPTADLTDGQEMDAATAGVKVTGILIDGQKDLTADLATDGDAKTVYEAADNEGAFATVRIDSKDNALANGNIFSIVSPTSNGESVNVNIEFELPAGVFLKQTNGNKVGSADSTTKIYLGLKLTKDADHTNQVFDKGLVTILNATVKNWGIASDKPVVITNAEIGVEFDTTWDNGNIYDVEI